MSIYVRVGSETIAVVGPEEPRGHDVGRAPSWPIPVEILEREIANSRLRQREAASEPRSGPFAPIDERDVVVAERAFAAGRSAGTLAEVPGADRLREALSDAIESCGRHNRDYHYITPEKDLAEWRVALAEVPARPASAPGTFVERKHPRQVSAVLWSGQNWPEVEAWLSGRVESAKLDPDDASVVVVWDEEARMRCRAGSWLIQAVAGGEVSTCPPDRFAKLYIPAGDPDGRIAELLKWRRWATALLKEGVFQGISDPDHDAQLRSKITAVLQAPAVMEAPPTAPQVEDLDTEKPYKQLPPEMKFNPLVVEACARVANAVYREALNSGDPMPSWDDASEDEKASERETVVACLSGVSPATYHARWRAEKLAEGWRYDPIKSDEQKLHPNLVPYAQLPSGQRALDSLFVAAVRATRRALADYEEASFVPALSFNGNLPPEQFAEFKREWERQVASSPNAWKTPLVDAPVQFVRPRSQSELLKFVDGLVDSMLRTPEMWGTPAEVEPQILLLLEVRAFELTGFARTVVRAFERFVAERFGDGATAEPLARQLTDAGRIDEFTGLMLEFVDAQRSAYTPMPPAVAALVEGPSSPAAGWVNDPFKLLDEVGVAMGRLTPGRLRELFEEHCECRPVNTARESHSHDCDTDVTDDVRTLLHHVVAPEPGEMETGDLRPSTNQEEIVARNRLATYVAEKARKQ